MCQCWCHLYGIYENVNPMYITHQVPPIPQLFRRENISSITHIRSPHLYDMLEKVQPLYIKHQVPPIPQLFRRETISSITHSRSPHPYDMLEIVKLLYFMLMLLYIRHKVLPVPRLFLYLEERDQSISHLMTRLFVEQPLLHRIC